MEPRFLEQFARSCDKRLERLAEVEAHEDLIEVLRVEIGELRGEAGLIGLGSIAEAAGVLLERLDQIVGECDASKQTAARAWSERLLSAATRTATLREEQASLEMGRIIDWLHSPIGSSDAVQKPGRRVLVLEDSEIAREMVAIELEEAGFPVEVAGNLVEFEEVLARFDPEIILTDVNLPDVQGDEICRVLKGRLETQAIPIILFSGLPREELAQLAKRSGADGYVSKEQGMDELIACIQDLLSQIVF